MTSPAQTTVISRLRWLALAVVALVLLVAATIYVASEWRIRRSYEAPLQTLGTGATDVAEGERMARIVGCWDGCHGPRGEGGTWELQGIARATAPTLSAVLPDYRDDELVRLVRYGLKRDGHTAVGMSSYTFWPLSDADLANIIAHLRQQPALPPRERVREISWRGRVALLTGDWQVSVEQVDRTRPRWGELPQTTLRERGRYLASITCTECHGLDYHGNPLERTPSLAILAAYTEEQFIHLMRTAEPLGGRTLRDDMQWVKNAPFTDEELKGLYQFLRSID